MISNVHAHVAHRIIDTTFDHLHKLTVSCWHQFKQQLILGIVQVLSSHKQASWIVTYSITNFGNINTLGNIWSHNVEEKIICLNCMWMYKRTEFRRHKIPRNKHWVLRLYNKIIVQIYNEAFFLDKYLLVIENRSYHWWTCQMHSCLN